MASTDADHQVFPYLLVRVKCPDGMIIQARFSQNETVSRVFGVLDEALRPEYRGLGFSLLSLGGVKRMVLKRTGGKEALRLGECGLSPPAVTLMLRWEGPPPEGVASWEEEGQVEEEQGWPCAWSCVVREELLVAARARRGQGLGGVLADDMPPALRHTSSDEPAAASTPSAAALKSKLAKQLGLHKR